MQWLSLDSRQLWQSYGNDKVLSLCTAEEVAGNEDAGKPLATQSRTPGKSKRLQRKLEVDGIDCDRQPTIRGTQVTEEMP